MIWPIVVVDNQNSDHVKVLFGFEDGRIEGVVLHWNLAADLARQLQEKITEHFK